MLIGTFSFSILTSIVAMSITSRRRPPRPRSLPLSPPLLFLLHRPMFADLKREIFSKSLKVSETRNQAQISSKFRVPENLPKFRKKFRETLS